MRLLTLLLLCPLFGPPSRGCAQEPKTSEGYITAPDGVRLFYRVYGDRGDTIIYLHGGPGGTLERQLPNLLPLAERHVIIAYDQRGGGRSDIGDTTRITPARHVQDLENVRRHFGVERPTLMGHSWGTAVAIMYADAYPQNVARLILNGPMPPARVPYDAQRNASVAARIAAMCAAQVGADATDTERQQCQRRMGMPRYVYFADTLNFTRDRGQGRGLEGGPGGSIGQRATLRALGDWDYRPALRRIRVPALVVEGAQTPVPLDQVRVWAESLVNGRLLLVEGAGHGYPYIEQPEVFFPAIEEFLAGRWPRAAMPLRGTPR